MNEFIEYTRNSHKETLDGLEYSRPSFTHGWKYIGSGSEGDVFTDNSDKVAYKVSPYDESKFIAAQSLINHSYKNVVAIYGVRKVGKFMIVSMERLQHISFDDCDPLEFDRVSGELTMDIADSVSDIDKYLPAIKGNKLRKIVECIKAAGQQLGESSMDIGFHNVMYDPKNDTYKQIDIL